MGGANECKSKSTLVDYHHTSCRSHTQYGWGKGITKTSSLLGQAYHLTWCTNITQKIINHTWAPAATSKMTQINTGKGYPIISRSITRTVPTIHSVKRHQSCLPQDSGSNRKKLHGPNRKVPSYIQQGQQVYPGRL